MKGNFHVQFLGEGVAATSPPYPTLGWATTQVYPARITPFRRILQIWWLSPFLSALSLTERCVEDGPEPKLVEQGPDGEDRPPGGGVEEVGVFDLGGVRSVPAEEPLELGEDLDQEVLAAEVGESALLDPAL